MGHCLGFLRSDLHDRSISIGTVSFRDRWACSIKQARRRDDVRRVNDDDRVRSSSFIQTDNQQLQKLKARSDISELGILGFRVCCHLPVPHPRSTFTGRVGTIESSVSLSKSIFTEGSGLSSLRHHYSYISSSAILSAPLSAPLYDGTVRGRYMDSQVVADWYRLRG
jgi:hypothetical protein